MPEPNPNLIVPVLINGAIFATVAVIVPAFLLSRFTRDIVGHSFTPWTYAIACVSFDWLVAIYIVIAYGLGLVGARRSAVA